MTDQTKSLAEVRRVQETQVERMRKMQLEMRGATPEERTNLQKEMTAIEEDIRGLDTVIQALLRQK